MNGSRLDFYRIWAPEYAEWSVWAKPVLFAELPSAAPSSLQIPTAPEQSYSRTMVIVDLPGRQSVEETLSFADKGCRPVPLYNGTIGSGSMLVNSTEVRAALFSGMEKLHSLRISPVAPPVFMLDSNRMNGIRNPSYYDNRWCVFPQDMPSAEFIKSRGIQRILVRANQMPQPDLACILYEYQKRGLALSLLQSMTGPETNLTMRKRSLAEEWAYRFKVTLGLRRNATGGFGGRIPDPYERRSSGGHYFRYG